MADPGSLERFYAQVLTYRIFLRYRNSNDRTETMIRERLGEMDRSFPDEITRGMVLDWAKEIITGDGDSEEDIEEHDAEADIEEDIEEDDGIGGVEAQGDEASLPELSENEQIHQAAEYFTALSSPMYFSVGEPSDKGVAHRGASSPISHYDRDYDSAEPNYNGSGEERGGEQDRGKWEYSAPNKRRRVA